MSDVQMAETGPQLYKVVLADIKTLKPAEYNPRVIEEDDLVSLMNSLDKDPEFLKVRPPIINTYPGRENIIIGGNQRVKAAKELGWTKIPVMFVKVKPSKEKKWNDKDNVQNGIWDNKKRQEIFMELHEAGEDLTDMSLTAMEVANILDGEFDMNMDPTDDPEYAGTSPSGGGKKKYKHMQEVLDAAKPLLDYFELVVAKNDPPTDVMESYKKLIDMRNEVEDELA